MNPIYSCFLLAFCHCDFAWDLMSPHMWPHVCPGKLVLVGLVLLVGRGTVAQLAAAIILSFGFFSLQMITWPYKIEQDNLL